MFRQQIHLLPKFIGVMYLQFITFTSVYGQIIITGTVSDTLSKAIPYAQVILKPEGSNNIILYTQANSLGKYNLSVDQKSRYTLTFTALSFKQMSIPVTTLANKQTDTIELSVTLKQKPIQIKELIFQNNKPIVVKRDTIIYKALAFAIGDERVVEDLLKRIPGINVEDDGKIKYNGREVEKVMVEGDDLFGKGYRLVSKNLHSNVVDKVEVYQHYSENPLLKNIEESEKVALNLTLTDDKKLTAFGNTTMGYTSNKHYEGRAVLMSFRKKTKYYFFGNSNTIGYDPVGDISQFIYSDNLDGIDDPVNSYDPGFVISLKGYSPNLSERRVKFNNSKMGSINGIFNPTNKVKVKIISFFTMQKEDFYRDGYQTFTAIEPPFTIKEIYSTGNKVETGFLKMETTYKPNSTSLIEYKGQYNQNNGNDNSYLIYNLSKTSDWLKNSIRYTDHSLSYTKKITSTNVLLFTGKFQYDYRPECYRADTFLFRNLFTDYSSIDRVQQDLRNEKYKWFTEVKSINRLNEMIVLENRVGFYRNYSGFSSTLNLIDSLNVIHVAGTDYRNDIRLGITDLYAGTKFTGKLKRISLNSTLDFHRLVCSSKIDTSKNSKSIYYIEPKFGINISINKKNTIQTYYSYNTSTSTIFDLSKGLVTTNYRTFETGNGKFEYLRGHTIIFLYLMGSPLDKLFLNFSAIYSKSNDYLTSNSQITPDYVIATKTTGDNKEMLLFSTSSDLYLKPLSSNLKLKVNASDIRYDYFINGVRSEIHSLSTLAGFEFRTAFRSFFNFHLGSSWTESKMLGNIDHTNSNNTQFLNLYFQFNKKIKVQFCIERYFFGNMKGSDNPWYFVDGSINYDIIPNKFSISFDANNIFNYNEFGYYSISDVGISSTQYRIVPRYLLLRINYRF